MMDIKQECPLHHSKPVMLSPLLLQGSQDKCFHCIPWPLLADTGVHLFLCTHNTYPPLYAHTCTHDVFKFTQMKTHLCTFIPTSSLLLFFFRTVFAHLEYTMPWRHETRRRYHGGRVPVLSMGNHSVVFALLWGGEGYNFKSPGKKSQDRKMAAYQTKKGNGWWAEKTSLKRVKTQTTHLIRTQSQNARTHLRFDLISACTRMWLTQLCSRKSRETPKETFFKGR